MPFFGCVVDKLNLHDRLQNKSQLAHCIVKTSDELTKNTEQTLFKLKKEE